MFVNLPPMSKSLLETRDMAKLLFYRYAAKLFLSPPGKEWRGAIVLVLTMFKCVSTLSRSLVLLTLMSILTFPLGTMVVFVFR